MIFRHNLLRKIVDLTKSNNNGEQNMSEFDVAIGINQDVINEALTAVYNSTYPSKPNLFADSEKIEDLKLQIEWDIQEPPAINFNPPEDVSQSLSEHFTKDDKLLKLSSEDKSALVAAASSATFGINIPKIFINLAVEGEQSQSVTLSANLVGRAEVDQNSAFNLILISAKVKLAETETILQGLLDKVLVPILIQQMKSLLGSIQIPPLTFEGITLSAPTILTEDGHLVALSNMSPKQSPVVTSSGTLWPKSKVFFIIGDNLKSAAINIGLTQIPIPGNLTPEDFKMDLGITTLKANVNLHLSTPDVSIKGNIIKAQCPVKGSASCYITTILGKIGFGYELYAEPNPEVTLAIDVTPQNELFVNFKEVTTFVILSHPSGNVAQWILSAATTPLLNLIGVTFVPLITTIFGDIKIPIFAIPDIPIDGEGISVKIHPKNLTIGDFNNKTLVSGDFEVSSIGA
jgi:hypothetical protein